MFFSYVSIHQYRHGKKNRNIKIRTFKFNIIKLPVSKIWSGQQYSISSYLPLVKFWLCKSWLINRLTLHQYRHISILPYILISLLIIDRPYKDKFLVYIKRQQSREAFNFLCNSPWSTKGTFCYSITNWYTTSFFYLSLHVYLLFKLSNHLFSELALANRSKHI